MTVEIRALVPADDRAGFRSGDPSLDQFFHRYAGQNQFKHHLGVTYIAAEDDRIQAFATVAPVSLDADALPSGRPRPPYPVPVLRIARLAVDQRCRDRGLGRALLRFCFELAERLSAEYGCAGVVVDAKSEAEAFYRRYGFESIELLEGASPHRPSPTPMFLSLGSIPNPRRTS